MSNDVALFAGDVMGTGFHAVVRERPAARRRRRRARPRPCGAVRGAGRARRRRGARVRDRQRPRAPGGGRGARRRAGAPDGAGPARRSCARRPKAAAWTCASTRSGDPKALDSAIRLTRACGSVQCIGVYAERADVHMGLLWLKAMTLRGGQANVIAPRRPRARDAVRGRARPLAAGHPSHEARGGARGLRGVRPPRGAEDRPHALDVLRPSRGSVRPPCATARTRVRAGRASMRGSQRRSSAQRSRSSSSSAQKPTARPAAKAAPSAVVSVTRGRTTGTPSTSAWNCISSSLAVMPPSTRSSAKRHAGDRADRVEHLARLPGGRLQRGAGEVAGVGVARSARRSRRARRRASTARTGRRRPARSTRRRCRARCARAPRPRPRCAISPSWSRSHCTAAPVTAIEPSST